MVWTKPRDLRRQVQKLWDKGTILSSIVDDASMFPKRLPLKGPSSLDLTDRFAEVRDWIASLQQGANYRLEYREIRHRVIGSNAVPKSAWIDSLEDALNFIGKRRATDRFVELLSLTRFRQPAVIQWIGKNPLKALSLAEDWPKLLVIIDWLKANPDPGIYLRQVDIPGIHSKFIEAHRSHLMALLDLALPANAVHSDYKKLGQFPLRYGFIDKPSRIRFRLLDPDITLLPGSNQDITIPVDTFRSLPNDTRFKEKIRRIFITENEINFLAFPAMANSMIIFGAGYGFDSLSDTPWVSRTSVFYWGDIDTHGFAILDQLRAHLPTARSMLMDKETLLAHQQFWGNEDKQALRQFTRLTEKEQLLFNDLRDNRFGPNVRLEQERIGFKWLSQAIKRIP